jgi:hypothetical protein
MHLNFGPQDILEKKFYKIKHRSIATTRAGSFSKTLHGTFYLEFNKVTWFKASAKAGVGGLSSQTRKELESKDNLARLCATLFVSLEQWIKEILVMRCKNSRMRNQLIVDDHQAVILKYWTIIVGGHPIHSGKSNPCFRADEASAELASIIWVRMGGYCLLLLVCRPFTWAEKKNQPVDPAVDTLSTRRSTTEPVMSYHVTHKRHI